MTSQEVTPLDQASAGMDTGGDTARLAFFERLADSELFLLLTRDAEGDRIEPEIFDVAETRFVLVFDREERLAQFVGKPAPYLALSGRSLTQMLAGQDIGLGVNLEASAHPQLLPPDALDWLAATLEQGPEEAEAQVEELLPPTGLPESLLTALDTKLATATGLARAAFLAAVRYQGGSQGHMLAFVDAADGAQAALAKAASEALTFSGIEAGALDVAFVASSDTRAASFAKVGLRFDIPEPHRDQTVQPGAPGRDPARPPKLR